MRPITEVLVAVQKSDRVLNRMMTETARNLGVTKPEMDVLLFLYNNPQYDKAADVWSCVSWRSPMYPRRWISFRSGATFRSRMMRGDPTGDAPQADAWRQIL